MRRLLRHRETRQYFVTAGEWTFDPERAAHFESVKDAYAAAVGAGLEAECAVTLRFERAEVEVAMPV